MKQNLQCKNSPIHAGVSLLITVYWQDSESRTLCHIRLRESWNVRAGNSVSTWHKRLGWIIVFKYIMKQFHSKRMSESLAFSSKHYIMCTIPEQTTWRGVTQRRNTYLIIQARWKIPLLGNKVKQTHKIFPSLNLEDHYTM